MAGVDRGAEKGRLRQREGRVMKGREAGYGWPIPMPSASFWRDGRCLPKPSQSQGGVSW